MATAHAETQQTLEIHKYIRLAIIAYKSQCVVEWRRRCYIWASIILRSSAPNVLYSYPRRMHFNVTSLYRIYITACKLTIARTHTHIHTTLHDDQYVHVLYVKWKTCVRTNMVQTTNERRRAAVSVWHPLLSWINLVIIHIKWVFWFWFVVAVRCCVCNGVCMFCTKVRCCCDSI